MGTRASNDQNALQEGA